MPLPYVRTTCDCTQYKCQCNPKAKQVQFYPHVVREIGKKGRILKAYGRIPVNFEKGTSVSEALRSQIKNLGEPQDHAGHIIPRCLNGSGTKVDNIFPQNAKVNCWRGYSESILKNAMQNDYVEIEFLFLFSYPDDKSSRPNQTVQSIKWYKNQTLQDQFTTVVDNPTFAETEGIVSADKCVLWRALDQNNYSLEKLLERVGLSHLMDNKIRVIGGSYKRSPNMNAAAMAEMITGLAAVALIGVRQEFKSGKAVPAVAVAGEAQAMLRQGVPAVPAQPNGIRAFPNIPRGPPCNPVFVGGGLKAPNIPVPLF